MGGEGGGVGGGRSGGGGRGRAVSCGGRIGWTCTEECMEWKVAEMV